MVGPFGPEIACPSEDRLRDYVAGRLLGPEATEISDHAASCQPCRQLLEVCRSEGGAELIGHATVSLGPRAVPQVQAAALNLEPGSRVARFILLDRIGAGGMGVVYSAHDPRLDRKIAIKFVRPDLDGATELLLREAQAQAKLSHPNVIAVYDVGSYTGHVYLALELVEGTTVGDWLQARPRSWREVLRVFLDAGRGLAAAHAAGLVHRDFKPSNVLIGADERVRVTDFGLARAIDDAASSVVDVDTPGRLDGSRRILHASLTATGTVLGTPSYMAPEQFSGALPDARSDLYSYSVSLYEALYGELPFAPMETTTDRSRLAERALARQVREAPPGVRVPTWLRRVLLKGLSARPEDRPGSMEELLRALATDPTVKWRRGVVAAVGLGVVAALVLARGMGRSEGLCKGAERKLVGVWDDATKRSAKERFFSTAAPYAEAAWAETERVLDRHSSQWIAMHKDACEATRLRGEQSDEVLSLRMICLDRRREELRALTGLLVSADRQIVQKAVEASRSLLPVEGCADVALLKMPVPRPADPAVRKRIEEIERQLARGNALFEAGKYRDAIEVTRPAVATSQEIGYRPLEAETAALLGTALWRAGHLEEGERTLKQGLWKAEAGHHDQIKARIAVSLAALMALRLRRFEESAEFAELASAILERIGRPAWLEMRRRNAVGLALLGQRKYDPAEQQFQAAIAVGERTLAEDPYFITVVSNSAIPLSRTGQLEEAESINRRVLALRQRILGADHPNTALSMNNLGWTLALAGKPEEGLTYLRRALAIHEQAFDPDSSELEYVLDSLSNVLMWEGKLDEALPYADRLVGLKFAIPCGAHAGSLPAPLEVRGEIRRRLRRYDLALADFGRCAEPARVEALPSLLGLGETYLDRGTKSDRTNARQVLERAFALMTGAENINPEIRARILFGLARAISLDGGADRTRALQLASEARQVFASSNLPRLRGEAGKVDAWIGRGKPP